MSSFYIDASFFNCVRFRFDFKDLHNIPCFGEKIKALPNNMVATSTMEAPDDKLYVKLSPSPTTAETAPKKADK